MLTHAHLKEVLHYNPETGVFTWLFCKSKGKTGKVAGSITPRGYRYISINGRNYQAHRLAWFYVYEVWPTNKIDHKYGDHDDNRIAHLRDVTNTVNSENRRTAMPHNKCGYLGVSRRKNSAGYKKPWVAEIYAKGIRHFLGCHETPEKAHQAYLEAKRRLHEGCTI